MDPVEFDPFSSTFFDDPYPVYKRLRDEAPVYHNDVYGFWALSRFDDVVAAHRDWETFTSTHGIDLVGLKSGDKPPPSMIMMDPPEHHRLRLLVSKVFSPRAIADLEPMVREVVDSVLEDVGPSFDGVEDFAGPFPVEIISRILGVPAPDRQRIRRWADEFLHRDVGATGYGEGAQHAMLEFATYLFHLVQEKRAHPTDDMLSRLCDAEVTREDGTQPLDDIEITGFATLLAGAGAETVTKLVANAIVLFARNRGEWQKILDDRSKIPGAVEEVLRFWPPSNYQGRYSTKDKELHGVTLPAGQPVLLLTGAATHDERAFEDPDRFDVERPPGLPIGFGHGIHTCLGAALARLEGRVAIEEMAARWPRFEIDEDGLQRVEMANVAGFSRVPVSAST
ncbi:MAG TPA: cytochrome P450 [Acidimicrobiales bacterium]|nr:cytochrome P450 [Acidimicrobiales bacterium]